MANRDAACLDRITTALMILDRESRVVFANHAARRILDRRDGLVLQGGLLRGSTPAETAAIRREVWRVSETAGGRGDSSGASIAVGRPGRPPLVVSVAPLAGSARPRGSPAAALLSVNDPEAALTPIDAFARVHQLTPAESSVASLLAQGKSIGEIADACHVSLHTARTHVKRVLAKTNTSRQAQLVSLILRSCAPTGG